MNKVMFVASGGGHWVQLKLISGAIACDEKIFLSTQSDFKVKENVHVVLDCSFSEKFALVKCFFQIFSIVRKERPTTILTTGAAPGLLSVVAGRVLGIRTIWIDSIANGDDLSLSGKVAKYLANVCCSQWEDVARAKGVMFLGRVI